MPSKQKIVRRGSVWGTGLTGNRPLGLRDFSLAVNRLGGALFSVFHPWEFHTNKKEPRNTPRSSQSAVDSLNTLKKPESPFSSVRARLHL